MASFSDTAQPRPLQYQPLHPSAREIRILWFCDEDVSSLRCDLETVSLDMDPPPIYTALSYVWGDDSTGLRDLIIDGACIKITANLHEALSSLRVHRGMQTSEVMAGWLWIDAVCINQADIQERNSQVAMMGDIYRTAIRTLIWLGPGDVYSDMLLDKLHSLELDEWVDDTSWDQIRLLAKNTVRSGDIRKRDILARPRSLYQDMRLRLSKKSIVHYNEIFARNIFARPWFSRKWVLQELVLSQDDPLIACGSRELTWSQLDQSHDTLGWASSSPRIRYHPTLWEQASAATPWFRLPNPGSTHSPNGHFTSLFSDASSLRLAYAEGGGQVSLAVALVFSNRRATDPRDQVYGILGLLEPHIAALFPVDYAKQSAEQLTLTAFEVAWLTEAHETDDFWCFVSVWDRWKEEPAPEEDQLPENVKQHFKQLDASWAVSLSYYYRPNYEHVFDGAALAHTPYFLGCKGGDTVRWRQRLPVEFNFAPDGNQRRMLCLQGYRFDTIAHAKPSGISTTTNSVMFDDFWKLLEGFSNAISAGSEVPIPTESLLSTIAGLRTLQVWQEAFGELFRPDACNPGDTPLFNDLDLLWDIAFGRIDVPDDVLPNHPVRKVNRLDWLRMEALLPLKTMTCMMMADRNIVRTKHGFVGAATAAVGPGDIVALVPGMIAPYVLRPVEVAGQEIFRLIGFAKIAAVTSFEQLDAFIDRSHVELETFKII